MGVRVREFSLLLGVLAGLLTILALQTGASGQASGETVVGEPVDTRDGKTYVAGELIVTYEESASEATEENAVEDIDGEVDEEIEPLDAEVVEIPSIQDDAPGEAREDKLAAAKEELENAPGVESVDYDYIVETFDPDDPAGPANYDPDDDFYYEQWGLDKPNFPAAWNRSNRGDMVRVAILDTGIAQDHEDLNYPGNAADEDDEDVAADKGRLLRQRDFVDDDLIAEDSDPEGHGTHVAGTVTAATNNDRGVAGGCPECNLLIGRVLGAEGEGTVSDVAAGIIWATDQQANVINLSLGGPSKANVVEGAINYAYNKNVVVVAAAGNAGDAVPNYPAAYPKVISVVATDARDKLADFSSYGGTVDVAAPGAGILSTVPGSGLEGYKFLDGTSMASPHVAALAALLAAQGIEDDNPATTDDNRTNTEIRSLILNNARDLGSRGRDNFTGHGRINALKSVRVGDLP